MRENFTNQHFGQGMFGNLCPLGGVSVTLTNAIHPVIESHIERVCIFFILFILNLIMPINL
jgi:hypothetical protein